MSAGPCYLKGCRALGQHDHCDDCGYDACVHAGPKPNPSAAAVAFRGTLPAVRVVPSINEVLLDIRSLLKQGVDSLKNKGGQFSPTDVRTLEGLARIAETTQRMDAVAREQLLTELAKLTDEQVEAAAADPTKLLEGK